MPTILNTDQKFKKAQQIVGRPETTDSNFHDDFLKSPPHNHDSSTFPIQSRENINVQTRENRNKTAPIIEEREALGINESLGREKKVDGLRELVEDNSLNPST